jgi:chaperonin GroEL (HSP60 family)
MTGQNISTDNQQRPTGISSIVNNEVDVQYGDEARVRGIKAAVTLADCIGTTLGPYGRDKLVINNGGNIKVTNETVSILRSLDISDPFARMIRDVTNSQIYNAGDGTTATVVLTGALLEQTKDLIHEGLHPTTIVHGYERGHSTAVKEVDDMARTCDLSDRTTCERAARTVFEGSSTAYDCDTLAPLVTDAVERVTTGNHTDLNSLRVLVRSGRSASASRNINGAIIDATPNHETGPSYDARVLIIDGRVEPTETRRDSSITLDAGAGVEAYRSAQDRISDRVVDTLSTLGVDVLVAQSVADEVATDLETADITMLTAVSETDKRFLARTLDVTPVPGVEKAKPADTARADIVYDFENIKTTITTDSSRTVTVELFSNLDAYGVEVKSTINDAIEIVAQIASDGRILPGGGAAETAMAAAVRADSKSVADRKQLAVLAFAEALETIPQTIARNTGLNPIEVMTELRQAHHAGRRRVGIDAHGRTVRDADEIGLVDTAAVKEHMLRNAVEAAQTIIQIDGIFIQPEAEPASDSA